MAVWSLLSTERDLMPIIKLLAYDQSLYINPNYTKKSQDSVKQL